MAYKDSLKPWAVARQSPDSGRILLDGVDLQDWDVEVLRRRIGVIFQNFVRYQFTIGENVGVGDVNYLEDETHWDVASEKGMAKPFIESLPSGFGTQLGRWFKGRTGTFGGTMAENRFVTGIYADECRYFSIR